MNRCGCDPCNEYEGGTVLLDPYGNALGECPDGTESRISAQIDMDELRAFREKFPVLEDADRFVLTR